MEASHFRVDGDHPANGTRSGKKRQISQQAKFGLANVGEWVNETGNFPPQTHTHPSL